jgi:uncharacterized protein (TIGR03437 family)
MRFLIFALALPLWAQINVLTYQYDNTRAGANINEVTLNKTNVSATGFGRIFTHRVDGQIYGQPLYVANITVPGQGTHDMVYVATEHDSVYAFDADSASGGNAAPLWQISFLNAARGVSTVPASDTGCSQILPAPVSPLSLLPAGSVTATIGGIPAAVQFAGLAPGFAGLYQVNIVVPSMPAGQYPLQISGGGVTSNAAPVNIQ